MSALCLTAYSTTTYLLGRLIDAETRRAAAAEAIDASAAIT